MCVTTPSKRSIIILCTNEQSHDQATGHPITLCSTSQEYGAETEKYIGEAGDDMDHMVSVCLCRSVCLGQLSVQRLVAKGQLKQNVGIRGGVAVMFHFSYHVSHTMHGCMCVYACMCRSITER